MEAVSSREVQRTLKATMLWPPEWTQTMPSISSHPGSPVTHKLTYSNLPACLYAVWVHNLPIPIVRAHVELGLESILSSSRSQNKHSACFHRGFTASPKTQPDPAAQIRSLGQTKAGLSFIMESLGKANRPTLLWKLESKITLHITHSWTVLEALLTWETPVCSDYTF